jgi:hypothetical protein
MSTKLSDRNADVPDFVNSLPHSGHSTMGICFRMLRLAEPSPLFSVSESSRQFHAESRHCIDSTSPTEGTLRRQTLLQCPKQWATPHALGARFLAIDLDGMPSPVPQRLRST